ncbi:metallophosphoesterase family protein [Tsuneonella mangrovi]|uniref:metallophosphoesterase family protein n=1 Tax=Tsuneonella mangrovi TaxID=1982042 RepID=UPI000BA26217|nr:metallophosphoesterase [Tsuneonella mangrovi]
MTDRPLLFHISDIHFGLTNGSALAWVTQEVAARKPAAVIITGDLTMRARHSEYAAARDWIGALDAPVAIDVGNHDMPYFNPVERFFDPYRRFHALQHAVQRELELPGIAVVPLKTTARAQFRFNWSKGWVTRAALAECLARIDALPAGTQVLVSAHHPLVEVGTHGSALTRGGNRALAELAKRKVAAVLSGHVHDPFDLVQQTANGPVRMIGAGTLSHRLRSTPQSFNELSFDASGGLEVKVRSLQHVPGDAMKVRAVPDDASPPHDPDDPVAPIGAVPGERRKL